PVYTLGISGKSWIIRTALSDRDIVKVNLGDSGFIANIEIFPSRKVSYYLIPMASVVEADGRIGYVYEVTPTGTAKKVKVTIATLYGTQAAISGGLENVKVVVSDGVAYLTDGMPVDIKKQ
ncbi:MAG: hypothetical protein WC865_16415, partial [Bacteroidales bacterium]